MSGNAVHDDILRFPQSMLAACFDCYPPCPWCQEPLPEHAWASLNGDTCVVACSNRPPLYAVSPSTDPASPVDGGP